MLSISESWRATYPKAAVGVLLVRNVSNPPTHPALEARKAELVNDLRQRYAGMSRADLEALPVLQAYNAYYKRFKKSYHVQLQLESVAFKGKPIPKVAGLVEAMFMAELKDLLLTAAHDLDALRLPIRLEVADGSESYTLMNGQEQVLKAGDMFIADEMGVISSIIYGPDRRTRITPATRAAIFTVYAPPGVGTQETRQHLENIEEVIRLFAPEAETGLLEVYTAD